jgi:hypothetical protein
MVHSFRFRCPSVVLECDPASELAGYFQGSLRDSAILGRWVPFRSVSGSAGRFYREEREEMRAKDAEKNFGARWLLDVALTRGRRRLWVVR